MEDQCGKITAVCTSEKKGTPKNEISSANLKAEHGIEGDAHAGSWHRQISLLSYDKVNEFRSRGVNVANGAFGENILVEGIDLARLPVGTKLRCGDILMEVTQIGKECHEHCAIYEQTGDCIMPREGIFARVLNGGKMTKGDMLYAQAPVQGGGSDSK